MNNRALSLSLLMAVAAVLFIESYVSSIEEEAKKKFGTELLVLVAKKDIKEMETINETMLDFKSIPKKFLEPAAIMTESKNPEDKNSIKTLKGLAGTVAIVPIKKGEQLTFNKITEPNMRTGLSPQVAPGRRAISLPVTEINSVSKLIKPGDRIDVIAILDNGGGRENKISKTILQDVVVLSVGRYITNNVARLIEADVLGGKERTKSLAEDFSFSSITIEVEPLQAQMIALVMNNGDNSLSFSLRNNEDLERINFPGSVLTDVLGPDASRVRSRK